jgi:hypothetical protein
MICKLLNNKKKSETPMYSQFSILNFYQLLYLYFRLKRVGRKTKDKIMQLINLFIYPIKSCQGISLSKAYITKQGLTDYHQPEIYDRQFMLVDQKGQFITQREYPQMATIRVEIKDNKLYLSSLKNNLADFELIPNNDQNNSIKVKIWRDQTIAIDQGDAVAKWFQKALKIDINCHLVKQSDEYIRPINPRYSTQKNQPVSFADGYPLLLTNTASLDELQRRLNGKYPHQQIVVPMNRFRPNIVVETEQPFIEDTWKKIKIGQSEFAVVKPCSRCIVTTTDQDTGIRDELKEPLLTLSDFRNTSQGIMFGQNLIPLNQECLNIGDTLMNNE